MEPRDEQLGDGMLEMSLEDTQVDRKHAANALSLRKPSETVEVG